MIAGCLLLHVGSTVYQTIAAVHYLPHISFMRHGHLILWAGRAGADGDAAGSTMWSLLKNITPSYRKNHHTLLLRNMPMMELVLHVKDV